MLKANRWDVETVKKDNANSEMDKKLNLFYDVTQNNQGTLRLRWILEENPAFLCGTGLYLEKEKNNENAFIHNILKEVF